MIGRENNRLDRLEREVERKVTLMVRLQVLSLVTLLGGAATIISVLL